MTRILARRPGPPGIALGAIVASCTGLVLLASTSTATAQETRPRLTHEVAIAQFRFVPNNLGIDIGDTVRWANTDASPHTIRFVRGPRKFGMAPRENLRQGERYRFTFNQPGIYHYEDSINGAQGEIRVGPKETTAAPTGPGYDSGPAEQLEPRRLPPAPAPRDPQVPRDPQLPKKPNLPKKPSLDDPVLPSAKAPPKGPR